MPWRSVSVMDSRLEFARLAVQDGANMRALCRRFGISPTTGYLWTDRYRRLGAEGLHDRPRRPHRSPGRTGCDVEALVVAARQAHPSWGGRKLRRHLLNQGAAAVPSASTITAILRRHALLDAEAAAAKPFIRFEHPYPNTLWQMDFKGHFPLLCGSRCHPLTVVDDHSRYAVVLKACANEQGSTVKACLSQAFRTYGLPQAMLMDNGGPWGNDRDHPFTPLTAWLIRLGIWVSHGRPFHPQTQGKNERFNKTLNIELISRQGFASLADAQQGFDTWRQIYNGTRPHEALGLDCPVEHYRISPRPFPEPLPPITYRHSDIVRSVGQGGRISFKGQRYRVPKAFNGYPVALRPTGDDQTYDVFFCHHKVTQLKTDEPA